MREVAVPADFDFPGVKVFSRNWFIAVSKKDEFWGRLPRVVSECTTSRRINLQVLTDLEAKGMTVTRIRNGGPAAPKKSTTPRPTAMPAKPPDPEVLEVDGASGDDYQPGRGSGETKRKRCGRPPRTATKLSRTLPVKQEEDQPVTPMPVEDSNAGNKEASVETVNASIPEATAICAGTQASKQLNSKTIATPI
jgi:hypothetical protein